MARIDSDVTLKANEIIPIEIKQSALEWSDILLRNLPFLVTIVIVAGSAIVTYWISTKSIKSQEKQSDNNRQAEHENKISDFRNEWLQNLRETASDLSRTIHLCQMYNLQRNCAIEQRNAATRYNDEELEIYHGKKASDAYSLFIQARADFYQQHAKIKLFFKPDDPNTSNLLTLLETVRDAMGNDSTSLDNLSIDNIVAELQEILKREWETTKNRSWLSSN